MKPDTNRINIVFWTDTLRCGGRERQFSELVSGLVRTGRAEKENLAVISMDHAGHFDEAIQEAGVRIVRVLRKCRWDPFLPVRARKVLKELQPDVVFSISEMASFYALVTPKRRGVRVIDGSIRNAFPVRGLKERALNWFNFRAADLVVANSKAGLRAKNAPPAKSAVLYNGFDFNRLKDLSSPGAVKQQLGIRASRVVGMVGSFSDTKDWDSFLMAAQILHRTDPDVCFVCAGGGEHLQAYRGRFGTQEHLRFTGCRKDVESLIGAFDIGVLCANAEEGTPNAVMEYMASGVPAIVAARGAVGELVDDGFTGFIIRPRDPQAVAQKIACLLADPGAAKAMGLRGQHRIRERFSMEKALDTLMHICASVHDGAGVDRCRPCCPRLGD